MASHSLESVNEIINRNVKQTVDQLVPECGKLQKALPKLDKDGREFLQPVALTYENGFSYTGDTDGAYNDAVPAQYDEIELVANPVTLQGSVNDKAKNRLTSEKAIERFMGQRLLNMKKSMVKRAEISSLYGGSGIGRTLSGASTAGTVTSGKVTIKMDPKEFAAAIFGGMSGARVEVAKASDGSAVTGIAADAKFTVVSIDSDAKTLTLQEATSGDAADLKAFVDVASQAVDFYFEGTREAGKDMVGLHKQITQQTGSLFGISKDDHDLFRGNVHSLGGAPTMKKILQGIAKAVAKGGLDEDVRLYLHPEVFEALNGDEAALRRTDGSYDPSKMEKGSNKLVYHGQNGAIVIEPHLFIKQGHMIAVPMSTVKRVGSKEIGFLGDETTDGSGKQIIRKRFDRASWQILGQYDWHILACDPAKCVFFVDAV